MLQDKDISKVQNYFLGQLDIAIIHGRTVETFSHKQGVQDIQVG